MLTFATLVLYERHGQPAIAYRAETIEQVTRSNMVEETYGAWELRCWMLVNGRSCRGVKSAELFALLDASFWTISYCLFNGDSLDKTQRFNCASCGTITGLPSSQPLPEHLKDWSSEAAPHEVFLQALHISTDELQAIVRGTQREIVAMAELKGKLA